MNGFVSLIVSLTCYQMIIPILRADSDIVMATASLLATPLGISEPVTSSMGYEPNESIMPSTVQTFMASSHYDMDTTGESLLVCTDIVADFKRHQDQQEEFFHELLQLKEKLLCFASNFTELKEPVEDTFDCKYGFNMSSMIADDFEMNSLEDYEDLQDNRTVSCSEAILAMPYYSILYQDGLLNMTNSSRFTMDTSDQMECPEVIEREALVKLREETDFLLQEDTDHNSNLTIVLEKLQISNCQRFIAVLESNESSPTNLSTVLEASGIVLTQYRDIAHILKTFFQHNDTTNETTTHEADACVYDCMNVCNGTARTDDRCEQCYGGTSNYTSPGNLFDCNGKCLGNATWNKCSECVGGDTERRLNYGSDRCGICIFSSGYRRTYDCNGECNGTATMGTCSRQCVGGNTNKSEEDMADMYDCSGECNGTAITDSCGYCVARIDTVYPQGSRYKDCNSRCYSPASYTLNSAITNECGLCVSQSDVDMGKDACGVCNGTNSTCLDCQGLPNGGMENDACGECGGNGTSCLVVVSASPFVIPHGTLKTILLQGAGFHHDNLECVAVDNAGEQNETISEMLTNSTPKKMYCDFNLLPGEYTIHVRIGGGEETNSTAILTVYNNSGINVDSFSPTNFTTHSDSSKKDKTTFTIHGSGFSQVSNLWCIFNDTESPTETKITANITSDTEVHCDIVTPEKSGRFTVFLSANQGEDVIGHTFTSTAFAEAAVMSARFHSSGFELLIRFDRSVDTTGLDECDKIFDNPTGLGEGVRCRWTSSQTMIITLGKADQLIEPGDVLTLHEGIVKAGDETYAIPAEGDTVVEQPSPKPEVRAVLTGPTAISSCGTVRLSGTNSWGGAGRPLTYNWTVSPDVFEISDIFSGGHSEIQFLGTYLTVNVTYTFTMEVQNFFGSIKRQSLTVRRLESDIPAIIISSNVDVSRVRPTSKVILTAKVTVSSCSENHTIEYQWGADVKINDDTVHRQYIVNPYDMPGGRDITFNVKVTYVDDPDKYSTASITLKTVSSHLLAHITGTYRVIGRGSGFVTFDGTLSSDPDDPNGVLYYEWSCKVIPPNTDNAVIEAEHGSWAYCYSHNDGDDESIPFPYSSEKRQNTLSFSAKRFRGRDEDYLIKLTVYVTEDTRVSSTWIRLTSKDNSVPKIRFAPLPTAELIEKSSVISLKAYVTSRMTVTEVVWRVIDESGKGYLDLTDKNNLRDGTELLPAKKNDTYFSILRIKTDKLFRGMKYSVSATAVDTDGNIGEAHSPHFQLLADVTGCVLHVPNYVELDTVTMDVSGCRVEEMYQPLTFVYKLQKSALSFYRLTGEVNERKVKIIGPASSNGDDNNIFIVEVCHSHKVCGQFSSAVVNVTRITSDIFHSSNADIEEKVKQLERAGDYLSACSDYLALVKIKRRFKNIARRRKRFVDVSTDEWSRNIMGLVREGQATPNTPKTLDTFVDQLMEVRRDELREDDTSIITDTYTKIIDGYTISDDGINVAQINKIQSQLGELRGILSEEDFRRIRKYLTRTASNVKLMQGDSLNIKDSLGEHSMRIMYAMLNQQFAASDDYDAVTVRFGSTMQTKYRDWQCAPQTSCNGVLVRFVQYNFTVDDFSTSDDDKDNRLSAIVEIDLLHPETGDILEEIDLTEPVVINITLSSSPRNKVLSCRYWNGTWLNDGLTTATLTDGTVQCATTHLTTFVVIGEDPPLTTTTTAPQMTTVAVPEAPTRHTGAIVGGVVGSILGAAVLATIVVLLVRFYKVRSMKVSSSDNVRPSSEVAT